MRRRDLIAAATGAAVATALAASVAWAAIPDEGVIHGCYKSVGGQLRVAESDAECTPSEQALSWNQEGQPGAPGAPGAPGSDGDDGVSPTVAQLAAGDANCPAGGAAITDAAGTTAYVCSGEDGADGQPFSGTFTSPNGQYSISVTDTGVTLSHGPGVHITLAGTDVRMRGMNLDLRGDLNVDVLAGLNGRVAAGALLDLNGSAQVRLNGTSSCTPAAYMGGLVQVDPTSGTGQILLGTPRVCVG